jgi:hypothetical protein
LSGDSPSFEKSSTRRNRDYPAPEKCAAARKPYYIPSCFMPVRTTVNSLFTLKKFPDPCIGNFAKNNSKTRCLSAVDGGQGHHLWPNSLHFSLFPGIPPQRQVRDRLAAQPTSPGCARLLEILLQKPENPANWRDCRSVIRPQDALRKCPSGEFARTSPFAISGVKGLHRPMEATFPSSNPSASGQPVGGFLVSARFLCEPAEKPANRRALGVWRMTP